jgi:hypothetical protein
LISRSGSLTSLGREGCLKPLKTLLSAIFSVNNKVTMADVQSPQTRSYNMSRIRSRDTRQEMLLQKWLFIQDFRYRKNNK